MCCFFWVSFSTHLYSAWYKNYAVSLNRLSKDFKRGFVAPYIFLCVVWTIFGSDFSLITSQAHCCLEEKIPEPEKKFNEQFLHCFSDSTSVVNQYLGVHTPEQIKVNNPQLDLDPSP